MKVIKAVIDITIIIGLALLAWFILSGVAKAGPNDEAWFLEANVVYTEGSHPYVDIIASYDWDVSEALEIVDCESGFDPTAVSKTNDHGLFQHNGRFGPDRFAIVGYSWSQRYDPVVNTEVAYWLWSQTRDWRHWTCRYVVDGNEKWSLPTADLLSEGSRARD